ncbi:MAG: DUF2220 family protein [Eubacteriales bacterium]|nr:DUF2220 family protein [Eubacteriales bacterium]
MSMRIPDYQKWILDTLLDKYEQSTAFQTGVFSRRIMFTAANEKKLQEAMEQIDEKHLFLTVLQEMKAQGLIDFSWVKHEAGNLVDRVWLVNESIDACYERIGRVSLRKTLEAFVTTADGYLSGFRDSSDLKIYLEESIAYTKQRKKLKAPFTADIKLDADILECLVHLDHTPDQPERVFSSKWFGDSKYFEHNLKSKVVSILKEIRKARLGTDEEADDDYLSDDDLLAERGLYRWPEIYELNGPIVFLMDDGSLIDLQSQVYGAYVNSDTVKHIAEIDGAKVERVIFIENKANYIDYQSRSRLPGDLVIYHGGCYSPMKGVLFLKICEGCRTARVYHWSDIDLGGFRIFTRLRKNIAPNVRPLFMDVETLQTNVCSCMEIKTDGYIEQLEKLLKDPEYSVFSDVIEYMIKNRIRLEQESLIC